MDISITQRAWTVNVPLVGIYGLISVITQPRDQLRRESSISSQPVDTIHPLCVIVKYKIKLEKNTMRFLLAIMILIIFWPTVIFADTYNDSIPKKFKKPAHLNLFDHRPLLPSNQGYSIDWTFNQESKRNYLVYEFRGIWRYAAKEIRSRFSRAYRNQLLDYWNQSNDLQFSWDDYQRELAEFEMGGEFGWRNRPWIDSISIDKDGTPNFQKIVYGKEGDWITLGHLVLTHDLKVRIKGTNLYFDGDQPIQDLKNKYILDNKAGDPKAVNFHADPDKSWFDSDLWKIKIKPSINFNLSGSKLIDFFRTISLKIEIDCFLKDGTRFGQIECGARYDFEDQEFEAVAFFKFVEW